MERARLAQASAMWMHWALGILAIEMRITLINDTLAGAALARQSQCFLPYL